MSNLDSTQCRAIIAELAAMLPPLFKVRASRRILSFGEVQDEPNRRTRWDPVFTGGGIVQFLITDPAARPASMTKDIDAVVEITSYWEFAEMEEALEAAGFRHCSSEEAFPGAKMWKGMRIDFLPHQPIHSRINVWFPFVLREAVRFDVTNGQFAWIASAPCFLATKFEAFFARGGGDYVRSKDIEDILAVIDGRPELSAEMTQCSVEVAAFVSKCIRDLLATSGFMDSLPYLIADDEREAVTVRQMRLIIS